MQLKSESDCLQYKNFAIWEVAFCGPGLAVWGCRPEKHNCSGGAGQVLRVNFAT